MEVLLGLEDILGLEVEQAMQALEAPAVQQVRAINMERAGHLVLLDAQVALEGKWDYAIAGPATETMAQLDILVT